MTKAENEVERPLRRLKKRELERRRAHLRNILIPVVAVAAVAALAAVVIITAPPPPPPHEVGPGEYVNDFDMHIHPHLVIYNQGQQVTIPANVGIDPNLWRDHTLDEYSLDGPSLSPLHTHEGGDTGIIHVESTVTRGYTLGEFFAVWGQPLGPSRTMNMQADSNHRLSLLVNGVQSSAWGNLVFKDGQQIEIHYDLI